MNIALLGLPGTGKTTLALHLAAHWPRPVFVLHTDLLKVTARCFEPLAWRGPIWTGDLTAKLAHAAVVLNAHTDKAQADGYDLIIEGSLAFAAAATHRFVLQAPPAVRQARIRRKHISARQALERAPDLAPLAARLDALDAPRLAATIALDALSAQILAACT